MLPISGKARDHCAKRHIADLVRSAKADVPLSDTIPLCRCPLRARPRRGGDFELQAMPRLKKR